MEVRTFLGSSAARWLEGVLAALLTPFVITFLIRLESLPLRLIFVEMAVLAVVLWVAGRRPSALGVIVGTTGHALLLSYLFMSWESIGP